jgi:hypothetical protein
MNLVAAYPAIPEIVNAVKKGRSAYHEAVQTIERLWGKEGRDYAVNQPLEVLRNMRKGETKTKTKLQE